MKENTVMHLNCPRWACHVFQKDEMIKTCQSKKPNGNDGVNLNISSHLVSRASIKLRIQFWHPHHVKCEMMTQGRHQWHFPLYHPILSTQKQIADWPAPTGDSAAVSKFVLSYFPHFTSTYSIWLMDYTYWCCVSQELMCRLFLSWQDVNCQ